MNVQCPECDLEVEGLRLEDGWIACDKIKASNITAHHHRILADVNTGAGFVIPCDVVPGCNATITFGLHYPPSPMPVFNTSTGKYEMVMPDGNIC